MKSKNKKIVRDLLMVLSSTPEGRISTLLDRLSSEADSGDDVAFFNMYECTTGEAQLALADLLKEYIN